MSAKKSTADKIGNIPPFGLRMLPELRSRIEAAAAATNRSMNSEIVARLEASFDGADRRWTDADLMEMATQLAEMLQKGVKARSSTAKTPNKEGP